jgi:hypothetical protein
VEEGNKAEGEQLILSIAHSCWCTSMGPLMQVDTQEGSFNDGIRTGLRIHSRCCRCVIREGVCTAGRLHDGPCTMGVRDSGKDGGDLEDLPSSGVSENEAVMGLCPLVPVVGVINEARWEGANVGRN